MNIITAALVKKFNMQLRMLRNDGRPAVSMLTANGGRMPLSRYVRFTLLVSDVERVVEAFVRSSRGKDCYLLLSLP